MKKTTLAALALLLAAALLLSLSACGRINDPKPTVTDAPRNETTDPGDQPADTPTDQPQNTADTPEQIREKLLAAFRADGYELKGSPVYNYLRVAESGNDYYDYSSVDRNLDGAYSLKFSDTDGDGSEELIVFRLVNEQPYIRSDGTELIRYYLYITGYDLTESGEVVSDSVATGLGTGALYELEGRARNYAAEKDGTIATLGSFAYEDTSFSYALYEFRGGKITERFSRSLTVTGQMGDEDMTPHVSGGSYNRELSEAPIEGSEINGDVGSPEVEQKVAAMRTEIEAAGLQALMFPLQPSGDIVSGDVFEDQCDLRFGPFYDTERETVCLFIEDTTGSFEKYSAAR